MQITQEISRTYVLCLLIVIKCGGGVYMHGNMSSVTSAIFREKQCFGSGLYPGPGGQNDPQKYKKEI